MLEEDDDMSYISIHAPREGSDTVQPDPPGILGISIHAPREGSDSTATRPAGRTRHFNPRSP